MNYPAHFLIVVPGGQGLSLQKLKSVSKNISNKKWTGEDAIGILEDVTEEEITIQDFGTVEVEIGDTKYCISYDTSELDKYQ